MGADVQPGQIWSLWFDTELSGMLIHADSERIVFWPVTYEPLKADESALIVPGSGPGETDVVLWPGIETDSTAGVLKHRIGTLLFPDRLRAVQQAYFSERPLPILWTRGTAPIGRTRAFLIMVTDMLAKY